MPPPDFLGILNVKIPGPKTLAIRLGESETVIYDVDSDGVVLGLGRQEVLEAKLRVAFRHGGTMIVRRPSIGGVVETFGIRFGDYQWFDMSPMSLDTVLRETSATDEVDPTVHFGCVSIP